MSEDDKLVPISIDTPPSHCDYAAGPCDQVFEGVQRADALFLYPNDPAYLSRPIEAAVALMGRARPGKTWLTWKQLSVEGQIIFCEICKVLRHAKMVVADITTLNFNLMFEIGFSIALGVPVIPIRDTSVVQDKRLFDELGLLDTLGYLDYQNSQDLATKLLELDPKALPVPIGGPNKEQPLFLLKSIQPTDGMVKLMSALKKSGLRFRTFDPKESARLSLHEAIKQVQQSFGVIAHIPASTREMAAVQGARAAFIGGMALAMGKQALLLQEGYTRQPIDYRDIVKWYEDPADVPDLLIPMVKSIVEDLQEERFVPTALPLNVLEKVDLGDIAAENEIKGLTSYFVPTGQYNEAKRGRARLVVGRKGAGKTAIFYGIRSAYKPSRAHLVLDLKPEGHQFTKLREAVLLRLPPGIQQHVLTALWNYILLMEMAHKIVAEDDRISYQHPKLRTAYEAVVAAYGTTSKTEQGDFSERLLVLVDKVVDRRQIMKEVTTTAQVTELVYAGSIQPLNDALSEYLTASGKEDIWLLFDNLDKGWPVGGAKPEDILIIRSLLEATRKLQRQFENRDVECHAVVFVRNDIYQHLVLNPADRGKDTAVVLDWTDREVFKEILRRRIAASTDLDAPFGKLWSTFFDTHVHGQESFSYILDRTLLRPREVLRFVRDCIDTAVSRGKDHVSEEDIIQAEKSYSDDALVDLTLELADVDPSFKDVPYGFIGSRPWLSVEEVRQRVSKTGVPDDQFDRVIDLLVWFGFLGIDAGSDDERYAYQFQHDIKKMVGGMTTITYSIHPGFRTALGCVQRSTMH